MVQPTLDELGPLVVAYAFRRAPLRDLVGNIEVRRLAFCVVPNQHHVRELFGLPGRQLGLARHVLGVRHRGALPVGSELPSVERALDRTALDLASVSKVSAEVRTECVEHRKLALLRTPDDEVLAEVLQRFDVTRLDLVGVGDLEPAVGDRRGEKAVAHRQKIERVPLFFKSKHSRRSSCLHEEKRAGVLGHFHNDIGRVHEDPETRMRTHHNESHGWLR